MKCVEIVTVTSETD